MTNGISLHLGLNRVDRLHYGSELPLGGCHNDARDMERIARGAGYLPTRLLDEQATAQSVLEILQQTATQLVPGDAFLLTYAGHGSQVVDKDLDEDDGRDETWVLYERMLLDDELHAALARFAAGVRIFLISDSCHSGTIARLVAEYRVASRGAVDESQASISGPVFRTPSEPSFGNRVWHDHRQRYDQIKRGLPGDARALVRAAVIQLSACTDRQLAADGAGNGLFTSKLKKVWANGAFTGNHREFWRTIRADMPEIQTPSYLVLGQQTDVLEQERPFTVEIGPGASVQPSAGESSMYSDQDQGNWLDVRAELERRIPGWKPPAVINGLPSGPLAFSPAPLVSSGSPSGLVSSPSSVAPRAASGPPVVRAFFWGFHIEISSQSLRDFLSVADPVNAIIAAIGPVTGPAAPFVLVAAGFVAGALQLLRNLDRGDGVYISMSWFAPGIFIPTTVPSSRAASASRAPGDPYEQAGDHWVRDYGGGLFGIRLEEDILWNLPDGTVRENVIVNLNPPGFGNIYFNGWLSDDPTVGHFRLHVGIAAFQGGRVNLRMMIRDAPGRSIAANTAAGPRALTSRDIAPSSNGSNHHASL